MLTKKPLSLISPSFMSCLIHETCAVPHVGLLSLCSVTPQQTVLIRASAVGMLPSVYV